MLKKRLIFVFSTILVLFLAALPTETKAEVKTWQQVEGNGFGSANNNIIYLLVSFKGYIYAGTDNTNGGYLYRSSDGTTWEAVGMSDFTDTNNTALFPLLASSGYLYVATANNTTGAEFWRSSDGENFTQINTDGFGSTNNLGIWGAEIYNDQLYASTENLTDGTQVWRYSGSGTGWTQVNTSDFAPGEGNVSVEGLETIGNYLYAGTINASGGQLWRYNGSSWSQIGGDGLGDSNNYSLFLYLGEAFEGYLYIGSYNTTSGGSIYRSSDGTNWTRFEEIGFGNTNNEVLVPRTLSSDKIYFGSANAVDGCLVWEYGSPVEQINQAGFGDIKNVATFGGIIFNDYLYVSTENDITGGQIWRTFIGDLPQTGDESAQEIIEITNSLLGL